MLKHLQHAKVLVTGLIEETIVSGSVVLIRTEWSVAVVGGLKSALTELILVLHFSGLLFSPTVVVSWCLLFL